MLPLALLGALAQFAPVIAKHVSSSSDVVAVADKVAAIATSVTGTATAEDAITALKADPQLAYNFQVKLLEQQSQFESLYFADKADARKRDSLFIAVGNVNYRAHIMFLLAVIMVAALVWIVWKDESLNEYVKGIFTLVLGRFLGYLDNIYNYEFGTTRANKMKDETINQLSASNSKE